MIDPTLRNAAISDGIDREVEGIKSLVAKHALTPKEECVLYDVVSSICGNVPPLCAMLGGGPKSKTIVLLALEICLNAFRNTAEQVDLYGVDGVKAANEADVRRREGK